MSTEALILASIPHGRENGTSMAALARATGMSEREVRAEIERLVTVDHEPIVTLPTNPGIFRAETIEECRQARAQIRSRAFSLLRRDRGLRLAEQNMVFADGRLF